MKEQLIKLTNTEDLVEIYNDLGDVDICAVAKVLYVSDDYVILANITPNGMYDGFSLMKTDTIFQINIDSRYLRKIKKLYLTKKQTHMKLEMENKNLMEGILDFAYQNKFLILVELLERANVQGIIKCKVDDILVLSVINQYGQYDGESIFKIEDITSMNIDDEERNCIKLLDFDNRE
ncbi:hypothetical protein [Bacillus sp. AFS088145]|uniref:hypothetical protein n=1 Tax=Bacillus sp. AFS088145 TaxID=2033514 RepID=UPI000BF6C3A2|nr:hypothetical protein [Bacillus sp. AFS088145]PFH81720.1 hypothetical protein COI44_22495 [Bacillus sp. AFS088145]